MTHEVIVAGVAEGDLLSIVDYVLETKGVERALSVRDTLLDAVASLDTSPQRGRIVPSLRRMGIDAYRELLVQRWRIIYRITGSQVKVVAIFDGSRDVESLLAERSIRDL